MPPNAALGQKERVTWDDYRSWTGDDRWEIIGGTPRAMSPSPDLSHQQVLGNLYAALRNHLAGSKCIPILSPIDVKLSKHDVVQPDLAIVCNEKQLGAYIEGAPALVVEILSESSVAYDRVTKMHLYERFKVKEYWIITPQSGVVEVYHLTKGKLKNWKSYRATDKLNSPGFPALELSLADIFDIRYRSAPRQLRIVKEPNARYGRTS